MRLIDANQLRKDIVERGAQLSGCYSAGIARYMDRMLAHVLAEVDIAPAVDAVPVVRCKDCKWYDPPHIDHGGGKRTDVEDDSPHVPLSVGINVGGRCMNTLREYCCNHDREDPDDYERLVKFRNRMDYCSDGERKDDE